MAIRTEVFIEEQHVPPALEWDGQDQTARHLLAYDMTGKPIACARVLSDGSIGRMAVLAGWRNQGVGSALLQAAIKLCVRNGWDEISLSAQTHAIGFYEKAGFHVSSEEYPDAGIPHRDMRLKNSQL
ncbi:MAG: GNAT family N-acetyltransferase [Nitrosomonadales bacterium]|nr:GNAT family N-acetyltransferase [Nitrosomonadales bacterium]